MDELWGLFWLGFILIPILYLISRIFNRSDEEYAEEKSGGPGKAVANFLKRSWHKSRQVFANIVFIILVIAMMAIIIVINHLDLKLSILIVVTLLCGGVVAFGYLLSLFKIFSMTNHKNYDFMIAGPNGSVAVSCGILIFCVS